MQTFCERVTEINKSFYQTIDKREIEEKTEQNKVDDNISNKVLIVALVTDNLQLTVNFSNSISILATSYRIFFFSN